MANSTNFSRQDSSNRLGGVALFKATPSFTVITEEPLGNLAKKVIHKFGELWTIEVDSSMMRAEGNILSRLDAQGFLQGNDFTIVIDEEANAIQYFFEVFEKELQTLTFCTEFTLNNESKIYLNHVRIDYRYVISTTEGQSNYYELKLVAAPRLEYTFNLVTDIQIKTTQLLLQNNSTVSGFNIFVETTGEKSIYDFLIGSTDRIEQAKKVTLPIYRNNANAFFLFVRIKGTNHFESHYIDPAISYSQITTN